MSSIFIFFKLFGRGFRKDWGKSQIKEFLEASCGGPLQVKVTVIDRVMPDHASVNITYGGMYLGDKLCEGESRGKSFAKKK